MCGFFFFIIIGHILAGKWVLPEMAFFGLGLFLGVIGLLVLHHGRGFGLFI